MVFSCLIYLKLWADKSTVLCLSDAWDGHDFSEQSLWEMNFSYIEGGLLGKRDHKSEVDKSFSEEKKRLGLVKTTGVQCWQVFSAAPYPPGKFVRLLLVFFPQITVCGGVVAQQTRGR